MIIRKKTFEYVIRKTILNTCRACGRNLSIKDKTKILNSALERKKDVISSSNTTKLD